MCHSLFEQYTTEALAGWRGDWRSVKFLPLELEPRLGARALDRPIDRDLAPWPGQCTVLGGIGSELVHDEGEGLRYPGVQHYIGTNSLDTAGEAFDLQSDDLGHGRTFEALGYEHRLTPRERLYALRQHFARLGKRSRSS